jgi:hypothetical protein
VFQKILKRAILKQPENRFSAKQLLDLLVSIPTLNSKN